ncbi:MAG: hypothetical protein ACYTF8_10445, partial [Planctomycetota bacterium]
GPDRLEALRTKRTPCSTGLPLPTASNRAGGDLADIVRHWGRHSEKTIRTLVRAYGLTERLTAPGAPPS